MNSLLPGGYQVSEATWFYLSLLLIVAVFFRFGRVWSLRNLDLALLLSMTPGLLLVNQQHLWWGYVWLFVGTSLLLVRLLSDGWFQRRPILEQNLNVAGMAFLCIASFAFLMTRAVTKPPSYRADESVRRGKQMLNREDATGTVQDVQASPTSSIVGGIVGAFSGAVTTGDATTTDSEDDRWAEITAARAMVMLAHLAVVTGLVLVGWRLFGEAHLGLAMATLYLLLPCTSYDVSKVDHVLPAALIIWAILSYRKPAFAGALMGLACGTLFFPVFLLPLWFAFYGRRNGLRFVTALVVVGALLIGSFTLTSADWQSFWEQIFGSFDWGMLGIQGNRPGGFWARYDPSYRIPVIVCFLILAISLTIWPRKKNLEHLIAHSAAIIVGTQFWHPLQGGVYLLWYLPLMLMVVFRPRLAHLTAPGKENALATTRSNGAPARSEFTATAPTGRTMFR